MPKIKINAEMAIAAAAMLTAIAATVVAVIQTNIMREEAEVERKHARISVMPSIMLMYSNGVNEEDTEYLELNIHNMGLGPAVVEEFSVSYKGRKLANQRAWVEAVAADMAAEGNKPENMSVSNSFVGPGRVIPAEQLVRPIRVVHTDLAKTLRQSFADTQFIVCACSVYGDCQRVVGLGQRPESLPSCKPEESIAE